MHRRGRSEDSIEVFKLDFPINEGTIALFASGRNDGIPDLMGPVLFQNELGKFL